MHAQRRPFVVHYIDPKNQTANMSNIILAHMPKQAANNFYAAYAREFRLDPSIKFCVEDVKNDRSTYFEATRAPLEHPINILGKVFAQSNEIKKIDKNDEFVQKYLLSKLSQVKEITDDFPIRWNKLCSVLTEMPDQLSCESLLKNKTEPFVTFIDTKFPQNFHDILQDDYVYDELYTAYLRKVIILSMIDNNISSNEPLDIAACRSGTSYLVFIKYIFDAETFVCFCHHTSDRVVVIGSANEHTIVVTNDFMFVTPQYDCDIEDLEEISSSLLGIKNKQNVDKFVQHKMNKYFQRFRENSGE